MAYSKGDTFWATYSDQDYVIVGKWHGNFVLASVKPDNDECLFYSANEIEELVNNSTLIPKAGDTQ